MPNHVTNRLEIKADNETVQKVMNFLKGEKELDGTPCYIDFNKIIPMPEELLIDASSNGNWEWNISPQCSESRSICRMI